MLRTLNPLDPGPAPARSGRPPGGWLRPRSRQVALRCATRLVVTLRAEVIAVALATGNPETAPARAATTQRVGRRQRTITTSHAERVTVTGRRYRCSAYRAELPPSLRRWTWNRVAIRHGS